MSPFLCIKVTIACFHAEGKIPDKTGILKIFCKALMTKIGDFSSIKTEIPFSPSVAEFGRESITCCIAAILTELIEKRCSFLLSLDLEDITIHLILFVLAYLHVIKK